MWALNRTVEADGADLVISTAHKSKGREWKSVRLMDDFLRSSPSGESNAGPDPSELRLLYVALTRAKEQLDAPEPIIESIERGITPQRERVEVPQKRHQPSSMEKQVSAHTASTKAEPPRRANPEPRSSDPPRPNAAPVRKGLFAWLFGR